MQRDQHRKHSARIGKVVTTNRLDRRIDHKPSVVPFVFDNEIGFISGGHRPRVRQISVEKRYDLRRGGIDVVDDRLMGKPYSEETPKVDCGSDGTKAPH